MGGVAADEDRGTHEERDPPMARAGRVRSGDEGEERSVRPTGRHTNALLTLDRRYDSGASLGRPRLSTPEQAQLPAAGPVKAALPFNLA